MFLILNLLPGIIFSIDDMWPRITCHFWADKDVFFIADFYCAECRLVIELDGQIHEMRQEYDARRTEVLAVAGLRVMRFKNHEVEEHLEKILDAIKQTIASSPSPSSLLTL